MKKTFILANGQKVQTTLHNSEAPFSSFIKHTGHYIKTGSDSLGFFLFESKIYVFINEDVYDLSCLKIKNILLNGRREFILSLQSNTLFQKEYYAEKDYDINPFWPTEEEDVDVFLWFYNVLTNTERVEIIRETCAESNSIP